MPLSKDRLQRMRENEGWIVRGRKANQAWTESDARELHSCIATAVRSGSDEDAEAWEAYLEVEARPLREMAQACREAEARIRAGRREQPDTEGDVR